MMQLDTAVKVFTANPKEGYTNEQVASAALVIRAEMRAKPKLLELLSTQKPEPVNYKEMREPDLADAAGFLKAQLKPLEAEYEKVKEALHEHSNGSTHSVHGTLYSVTIGADFVQRSLSLEKLEKANPKLFRQLEQYITHTMRVGNVLVKARG